MKHSEYMYDIIVVGGGHAGIEAALISAKKGLSAALITLDASAIGRMSCNPAIGGLAKGQMVREIDVLGGSMGLAADRSGIQFKMLNKSKGKAVWSPRAQVDKRVYESIVQKCVGEFENIKIIEDEAVAIIVNAYAIKGVRLRSGIDLKSRAVVLTCGTFLNGLIHVGDKKIKAGRMGERGSIGITESLQSFGFSSGRLKTGTPPRLNSKTIDWQKAASFYGDDSPTPFSYRTAVFSPPNEKCHIIKTNKACHDLIEINKNLSAMYSGDSSGVGARYCPSIEDKVVRFSHHSSHTLFLEPEWLGSNQIYLNGFSTSLPEAAQLAALQKIPALKDVKFFRPGYAIEYDFIPPAQLKGSLETKDISGLFFAGQINGTSGYEEAAAQGLIAGINACQYVNGQYPVVLKRNEAYIGVLIDDLITKDTHEPYRMFTSRAEYRLLLRFSNTLERLLPRSSELSLLNNYDLKTLLQYLSTGRALGENLNKKIKNDNNSGYQKNIRAAELLKRPEIKISDLPQNIFKDVSVGEIPSHFLEELFSEIETKIKYNGYIARHEKELSQTRHLETFNIPKNINYKIVTGLSNEALEKMAQIRPENIGQAKRISGVTPCDISVLMVWLNKYAGGKEKSLV